MGWVCSVSRNSWIFLQCCASAETPWGGLRPQSAEPGPGELALLQHAQKGCNTACQSPIAAPGSSKKASVPPYCSTQSGKMSGLAMTSGTRAGGSSSRGTPPPCHSAALHPEDAAENRSRSRNYQLSMGMMEKGRKSDRTSLRDPEEGPRCLWLFSPWDQGCHGFVQPCLAQFQAQRSSWWDSPGLCPHPGEGLDALVVVDILLSRETIQRKFRILGMGMGMGGKGWWLIHAKQSRV